MPVETKIDLDKQLTIKIVTGSPSFNEGMTAFSQFYEGTLTKNVIWDFSNADLSDISSDQIKTILDYIGQHAEKRAGGKTAIVILKDLEYGISRMILTLSELKGIPIEAEIFRTMDEAVQWIDKKD